MRNIKAHRKPAWKEAPFFRLLVPLLAGIIMEKNFPGSSEYMIPVFCLSVLLIILSNAMSLPGIFGLEWIPGAAIQFAFFSFGVILMFTRLDIPAEKSFRHERNQSNFLLLQILIDPVPKQYAYKCMARINWLIKGEACYYENEKVLVYFHTGSDARQYTAGSLILIRKPLQPIENFMGYGFDYKKYCRLRHIYSQVFLKENDFALMGKQEENMVFSRLDTLRRKLLIIIKNFVPRKSENGLLEALMVGFTEDLDPGLLKSYADTGVIHIIAISGLHLALICHILQLAFQRMCRRNAGRWIKFVLMVSCLWGYSLLSGASPSVIRAATMFSLVLFAGNILRKTVIYNTLAASAFLLVCFDPYWLWDIGFQLSYAAVLSLGLFSKPVYNLMPLQNRILLKCWNAASISIAAQLLTTPLSIYYFHRFPNYFLITNLLAVPLSSAILLGGILLCVFFWVHPAAWFLGGLTGLLIKCLNGFIQYVSQIPGAVISHLILTGPQLILVYFILFCLYRFLILKQTTWLLTGLACICLFQILRLLP
jgi:competence protein ComEC